MIRFALVTAVILAAALIPLSKSTEGLRVGSKKFTESVILGEIAVQLLRSENTPAVHVAELGGSRVLFNSLLNGDLDAYPEYTGTLRREILASADAEVENDDKLRQVLARDGIAMTESLGFNNTYALAVMATTAEKYGLRTISDLASKPGLSMSFSNEFMDRADGWPGLRTHYGLPHEQVRGVDHDIAYRQLVDRDVDVIDAYVTDAKLRRANIVLLQDDQQFFPRYDAVFLYRKDVAGEFPVAFEKLETTSGSLPDALMTELNVAVDVDGGSEPPVAAKFLREQLGVQTVVQEQSLASRLKRHTLEHLDLVRKSLIPAILVAIPLGVLAAKSPTIGSGVLGIVGIVQTIPALALLVLLMPAVNWFQSWMPESIAAKLSSIGAGSFTAVAALFLYSLLPIVRNTCTGIQSIPPSLRESSLALGISARYRLIHVELPLAAPTIVAGIKTASVLNIGFATLGALIGAGGYGQPILTGIRLANNQLIMLGALPAAAMAVLAQMMFRGFEALLAPRGLRLNS